MDDNRTRYTTQLQAGLGLIQETRLLLSIYTPEMTIPQLHETALESGLFPMVSARRLRNIIAECFSPRYVKTDSAQYLKLLQPNLASTIFNQLLLVFTAQANQILLDFINEVYWKRYSSGRDTLSTDDAKDFVLNAVREGKTQKIWSDTTIRRVSSYLIGCCADYGLLSSRRSSIRQILTIRLQEQTFFFFSYWLHFLGVGDNRIINHPMWKIFGLEPTDVREELKRMSKNEWEKTNKALANTLGNGTLQNRLESVLLDLESDPKNILLITDIEALHPYMRIGAIESQLQGKFSIPTLFFYPGIRTGKTRLKFLGFYPEDGNYRSVHVGG